MADKLVSVNDDFDFPAPVAARQAARLGDATTAEGKAVGVAVEAGSPPPVSAFQDVLGRIRTGVQDVNILIVSDSTAAMSGSWADKLPALLAAEFPTHTVSYRKWVDATNAYSASVTTGSGRPRTLHLWNGSTAGKNWEYPAAASRRGPLLADTNADLVIFSHGHNENAAQAQGGSNIKALTWRAIGFMEEMREMVPSAAVVISSQNPLTASTTNTASEFRADAYRRLASMRGYGFLDITQAFHDAGTPLSALVSADDVHPTDAGHTLWASEVMRHFRSRLDSQPLHSLPPAFTVAARNYAPNAAFLDFPADDNLTGWARENVSLSKDAVNFETGSYALKMTKVEAGKQSWMRAGLPVTAVRGRTVTFAARLRQDATVTSNAGQISIFEGGTLTSSSIGGPREQFQWRVVTRKIPAGATSVEIRISCDPSNGETANVVVDRISVVMGDYPADLL